MSRVFGATCVSVAALVACGGRVTTTSSSSPGGAASKGDRDGAFSSSSGGVGGAPESTRYADHGDGGSLSGIGGTIAAPDSGTGGVTDAGGATGTGGASAFDTSVDLTSAETQVWVGEVDGTVSFGLPLTDEDHPVPEHVVLVLKGDAADPGSLVIGGDPPPPKATDPSVFYPPLTGEDPDGTYTVAEELLARPYDGFPYSLLALDRTETTITFQIAPAELYTHWCALQTHITSSAFQYGLPTCGRADLTSRLDYYESHDPNPVYLCDGNGFSACECDKTSCHARIDAPATRWTLSLGAQNGLLEGQMWEIGQKLPLSVRLKRLR